MSHAHPTNTCLVKRACVHFDNPISFFQSDAHLALEKSAGGQRFVNRSILKHSQILISSDTSKPDALSTLPPMTWGRHTLHKPADIHLIPACTDFLETPYGLAVRSPACDNSIAYLNKNDCIIQRSESLSGPVDSGRRDKHTLSHYAFGDW